MLEYEPDGDLPLMGELDEQEVSKFNQLKDLEILKVESYVTKEYVEPEDRVAEDGLLDQSVHVIDMANETDEENIIRLSFAGGRQLLLTDLIMISDSTANSIPDMDMTIDLADHERLSYLKGATFREFSYMGGLLVLDIAVLDGQIKLGSPFWCLIQADEDLED